MNGRPFLLRGGELGNSSAASLPYARPLLAKLAPGVFRTPLNQALLDSTDRGRELLARTPMRRFGKVEELVGLTVFLASEAASFVNGHVLVVDGGFLASGVNQ